jgi:hypothetical protein
MARPVGCDGSGSNASKAPSVTSARAPQRDTHNGQNVGTRSPPPSDSHARPAPAQRARAPGSHATRGPANVSVPPGPALPTAKATVLQRSVEPCTALPLAYGRPASRRVPAHRQYRTSPAELEPQQTQTVVRCRRPYRQPGSNSGDSPGSGRPDPAASWCAGQHDRRSRLQSPPRRLSRPPQRSLTAA